MEEARQYSAVIDALKIFSPLFALAAILSAIQLRNSLRFGLVRWPVRLRSREEIPVAYWLVVAGTGFVLLVSLYMLGEAFIW